MRILCLHGGGLNADIMQRQMAGIIDALDPTYDFVFIEGEIERPAAPGVPDRFSGPFYCYYDDPDPTSIRAACDLLDAVVEEEGPFDGFIGFSQGAAVGVSYVMDREINHPDTPCPFHWMLLFSCTIALSPDGSLYDLQFEVRNMLRKREGLDGTTIVAGISHGSQHGNNTSLRASKMVRSPNRELYSTDPANFAALEDDYYALIEAFVQSAQNEGKEGVMLRHQDEFENPSTANALLFYHPGIISERLPIPTIHCVGKNDMSEILEQSKLIRDLCEKDDTTYLEHTNGHDIPRDSIMVQAIASAVRNIIEQSRWKARRPIC